MQPFLIRRISRHRKAILFVLLCVVLFLLIMNINGISSLYLREPYGKSLSFGSWDFDAEKNIPTYFSVGLLLFASFLSFCFVLQEMKMGRSIGYWALLAVTFVFLAADERLALHERLIHPTGDVVGDAATGIFFFAWVLPYIGLVLVFGLIFVRFLARLPLAISASFVLGGFFYVGGAIGMEMVSGDHVEIFGKNNFKYAALYTVEETLEMLGVVVFIYALLVYAGYPKFSTQLTQ